MTFNLPFTCSLNQIGDRISNTAGSDFLRKSIRIISLTTEISLSFRNSLRHGWIALHLIDSPHLFAHVSYVFALGFLAVHIGTFVSFGLRFDHKERFWQRGGTWRNRLGLTLSVGLGWVNHSVI
ncbi:hypothetical protein DL98DRAFT_127028 [Cadophora sp. DSE1049]|nr:hypothetical protein DL98DRAFT_127028 [Cadophora sp. DSE1049]